MIIRALTYHAKSVSIPFMFEIRKISALKNTMSCKRKETAKHIVCVITARETVLLAVLAMSRWAVNAPRLNSSSASLGST